MVIYSEKTNKRYDTVQECINAEAEFDRKRLEAEEKRRSLEKEKDARRKEIQEAQKEIAVAREKYNKLVVEYYKDYRDEKEPSNVVHIDDFLFPGLLSSFFANPEALFDIDPSKK